MISNQVVPCIRQYKSQPGSGETFFQQDGGAPSHAAKANIDKFGQEQVALLPNWPPRSPDLSPIENF